MPETLEMFQEILRFEKRHQFPHYYQILSEYFFLAPVVYKPVYIIFEVIFSFISLNVSPKQIKAVKDLQDYFS